MFLILAQKSLSHQPIFPFQTFTFFRAANGQVALERLMDLQWAAEQAQAAEKEWQDAHKEAGRMGGGPPTHNWPENKLDNFTASYPGASNYQSLKVMNGDQEEYQCDECSSVYGKISGIANHKKSSRC